MSFSNKRNQGFLDLGLVQEIHKMSQEYLTGPESKEVLKQTHEGPQTMMETVNGHSSQLKEHPWLDPE